MYDKIMFTNIVTVFVIITAMAVYAAVETAASDAPSHKVLDVDMSRMLEHTLEEYLNSRSKGSADVSPASRLSNQKFNEQNMKSQRMTRASHKIIDVNPNPIDNLLSQLNFMHQND